MAAGISGSLIPSGFLTDVLPSVFSDELQHAERQVPHLRLVRWWKRVARQLGPRSGARSILDIAALPLVEVLGYEVCQAEPIGDGIAAILTSAQETRVLLLVVPWTHSPDRWWREIHRAARTAGVRWAFVTPGRSFHLVDTERTWSRRVLDFDLEHVMRDERALLLLWLLTHAEAVAKLLDAVVRAADAHAGRVCHSLGDGVLVSLGALMKAMQLPARARRAEGRVAFDQALTVVYRILFLLFAEARSVVPTWHRVYREAYTIDALCRRSIADAHIVGLWESLLAISRLAHAGCSADDLRVTAFNGRLFSPRHTDLVERSRIPDGVVREAILALATGPSPSGRQRIAYADLGVEELGAVYERVLEYEPSSPTSHAPVVLSRTSADRKTTGSFYTPRSLTEFLVRRTLHPLVDGRTADEILALRVVDPAMGSGAFLVAACRFLSRAVEQARLASGEWNAHEITRDDRIAVRRLVAQRCLYGVDLNPTAVQLTRLSLWLTTLARDRPITFLDHHLAVGDSLVGASLDDLARQPPCGGRRTSAALATLPLFDPTAATEMATAVLPRRFQIAEEPGDTAGAVHDKERALRALDAVGAPLTRWKTAADLWCAGWFWPDRTLTAGVYADLLSAVLERQPALVSTQATALLNQASALARAHHVFHWQLEFPEVFFNRDGTRRVDRGFDAVLGNPPWDVLRSDTGSRDRRAAERRGQRQRLGFFRSAGVYRLAVSGHPNRYQLFVERALQLLKPGGRLGLILPAGVATDHGSASLRRALLDSTRLERILGFTNRDAIFPIHRDMRFLLVTATQGRRSEQVTCRFGLRSAAWLDTLPDNPRADPPEARRIVLLRTLLDKWDRDTLSIPEIEDERDLDILSLITATVPTLSDRGGWNARFGRELNATDDRPHFERRSGADRSTMPVLEGKHLEPFRVDVSRASYGIAPRRAAQLVEPAATYRRRRLAYREVASATNRLTLIASLLPAGTISTHTVFCLKTVLDGPDEYCLLGLLNSLVANYLVRLQVTTHVSASVMARLRVPFPVPGSEGRRELIELARRLERTGMEQSEESYARLNAVAARLYGLSRAQYEHIVGTFPLLPAKLRTRCLAAYTANDRGAHGG